MMQTGTDLSLATFDRLESSVRSYVRSFPTVFAEAQGSWLTDEEGRRYLDFFAGAGSLNYGHNPEPLKEALLAYIGTNGIVHGLDMATEAKRQFMETFEAVILQPRQLEYKMQFTGPTGTNAVEAALKIARQKTGRTNVICFTNAFHGVTAGAVAATGNSKFRQATGMPLGNTTFMPYCGYFGKDVDTLAQLEQMLDDRSSGVDKPAAVLLETVQGEGGVNAATVRWLRRLREICRERDILMIVDDIQVGCGRTGQFFSFELACIEPDIVTLSKSLSGYGLPMSLVLLKPDVDIWEPAAHNGTFRGNNLAFVTATQALLSYWQDPDFSRSVFSRGTEIHDRLQGWNEKYPQVKAVRSRGMIAGLVTAGAASANAISEACFRAGLIIETCGPAGEVIKLLPPLTITSEELDEGLSIIEQALVNTAGRARKASH